MTIESFEEKFKANVDLISIIDGNNTYLWNTLVLTKGKKCKYENNHWVDFYKQPTFIIKINIDNDTICIGEIIGKNIDYNMITTGDVVIEDKIVDIDEFEQMINILSNQFLGKLLSNGIDNSYSILHKLKQIIGLDGYKQIRRRPNQIGGVGGDNEKCWAFDIDFVDYEIQNHKNEKGSTLDNMDYWMPIIRKKLNVSESYFHESNYATIWIFKEGKDF